MSDRPLVRSSISDSGRRSSSPYQPRKDARMSTIGYIAPPTAELPQLPLTGPLPEVIRSVRSPNCPDHASRRINLEGNAEQRAESARILSSLYAGQTCAQLDHRLANSSFWWFSLAGLAGQR